MNWRLESRDSYYEKLVEWWTNWGFPILRKESLPERIFVVSKYKEDLYAVPVYITDSAFCWVGFPTSNKQASLENKEGSLEYLFDKIETCMKYHGYTMIMTTTNTKRIEDTLISSNYALSDTNVNQYIKNI